MTKRVHIIATVIIVVAACALFALQGERQAQGQPVTYATSLREIARNQDAITAQWTEEVQTKGAQSAFDDFAAQITPMTYFEQHLLAHYFGEALYKGAGLESFVVCDARFGFGCQHGFFGAAIREHGLGVAKTLDETCVEKFGERGTGCSHGIGHAVLSEIGFDKLNDALSVCKELTWKGELGGCSSGVFMENNFRSMEKENPGPRPFDESKRDEPCASGASSYREACYFEQPAWWRASLENEGASVKKIYSTIGQWCSEVPNADERESCFRGVGNIVPANSNYDVALSVERCGFIKDAQGEIWCRRGAAWGFFSEPSRREQAVYMCSLGASDEEKAKCLTDYQII